MLVLRHRSAAPQTKNYAAPTQRTGNYRLLGGKAKKGEITACRKHFAD